jgi:predicted CXXCH cytochrome family protein
MGCHGDNGTRRERPCVICHNDTDLPGTPHRDGGFRHLFADMSLDQECVTCHNASDMDGEFLAQQDLTLFPDRQKRLSSYFSNADFCLRCHNRDHQVSGFEIAGKHWRDPLVAMEDNYLAIDIHGHRNGGRGTYSGLRDNYHYASRVDCTDCHAMHGTQNNGLIIDKASKGVSALEPDSFIEQTDVWTGEGQYAQLCVLCHQMNRNGQDSSLDTGNGLSGVHQASGDCRDCHAHGQAGQAGF